jgi:hypothetical protein
MNATLGAKNVSACARTDDAVFVRLKGGLGNQMFQYAAGLAVAKRCGCPLKIDPSWFATVANPSDTDRSYMLDAWRVDVPMATVEELAMFPKRKWRQRNPLLDRALRPRARVGRVYRQPGHHYDPGIAACRPPVLLAGYFQTEAFFADLGTELRATFQPRRPLSENSSRMLRLIEAADWPVALHLRRGDYVASAHINQVHGTCPPDYYRRAVRLLDALSGERAHYFVFSDEPEAVDEVLGDLPRQTIVSGNDDRPWEDMTLMAACRDNIVANSSFSWWGAWLNPGRSKTVIAPRRWFRRDAMLRLNTVDLMPDEWITL